MANSAVKVMPFKKDIISAKKAQVNANLYLVQFQAKFQQEASSDYQTVPASKSYTRTGNLGRGWRVPGAVKYGADYVLTITNPVLYAGFVQGPKKVQARAMRRRGWRDTQTLARAVEQDLNRRFRKVFSST